MPKLTKCSDGACVLRPSLPGKVKVRGLRALEKANRELVRAVSGLSGLGDTTWGPAPTLSASFYVGLNRGKEGKNRTGWCSTQPEVFTPKMVDERFVAHRELAMEYANRARPTEPDPKNPDAPLRLSPAALREKFGASRVTQAGWFQSDPEASHKYTVFWSGGDVPGEETPEKFADAMRVIADRVSSSLCQDSVVLAFDAPTGNTGEGHAGNEDDYRRSAGMFAGLRGRRRR